MKISEELIEEDPMKEAARVKGELGIGISLHERIIRLKANKFQYARAGDARALVEEIERLNKVIEDLTAIYPALRKQVLEEAAKECESIADNDYGDYKDFAEEIDACRDCAIFIRSLMDKE